MEQVLKINGRDFLLVKETTHKGTKYLYAIATDETMDIALLKETMENGEAYIESVNDEEERKEILLKLVEE